MKTDYKSASAANNLFILDFFDQIEGKTPGFFWILGDYFHRAILPY
jgi:hypothetical protein